MLIRSHPEFQAVLALFLQTLLPSDSPSGNRAACVCVCAGTHAGSMRLCDRSKASRRILLRENLYAQVARHQPCSVRQRSRNWGNAAIPYCTRPAVLWFLNFPCSLCPCSCPCSFPCPCPCSCPCLCLCPYFVPKPHPSPSLTYWGQGVVCVWCGIPFLSDFGTFLVIGRSWACLIRGSIPAGRGLARGDRREHEPRSEIRQIL